MPSAALPVGRRADPIRMTRPRIDWKGRFRRTRIGSPYCQHIWKGRFRRTRIGSPYCQHIWPSRRNRSRSSAIRMRLMTRL